jgi:hypothetical protein
MPNYFILNSGPETYSECLEKNLFGAGTKMQWLVEKINTNDILFLSLISKKTQTYSNFIEGPFIATSNGKLNIDINAFNGKFPWQVKVDSSFPRNKIFYNDYKKFFEDRGIKLHDDVFPKPDLSQISGQELLDLLGLVISINTNIDNDSNKSVESDFRKKYETNFLCSDGHYVRSLSEQFIDNWLYNNDVFHSYEKKLRINEPVYTDFYIKKADCYIEFWGLNEDPVYKKRKTIKKKIYEENNFKLIELDFNDLKHLDDILPKKLLQYGLKII